MNIAHTSAEPILTRKNLMKFDSQALTLHLHRAQMVRLPETRGARVACLSGSVWITEDGDVRDIVLEPGESHLSDGTGAMLIYGLEETDIDIADPADDAQVKAWPALRIRHA